MMTVGVKYSLSKRTALFASYQESKGGSAAVATGFANTRGMDVVADTNKKNTGYGVSVVHSF